MANELPTLEIYSSIECPYAYLATYRLRKLWPEYANQVKIVWRALPLEYINQQSYPKPLYEAEYSLFQRIEPDLPWQPWSRPDWQWPTSYWPAFEALACAQSQGSRSAFEMSWALRYAYFAQNRCLSLRHEVYAVAEELALQGHLDLERFRVDWDHGRYKAQVIAECRKGWREIRVDGSATFIFPEGRRLTNPAVGEIDFDEENFLLRDYRPYPGNPQAVYREILDSTKSQAGLSARA